MTSLRPNFRPKPATAYVPPSTDRKPINRDGDVIIGKAAERIRRQIGYEPRTPACKNCVHYRMATQYMVDSVPRWGIDQCKKHRIGIHAHALCDHWQGANGETLEAA